MRRSVSGEIIALVSAGVTLAGLRLEHGKATVEGLREPLTGRAAR